MSLSSWAPVIDEAYSRYSPGPLLAFKFTCQLRQRAGTEWLDPCSDPKAVMAKRVWKQRRPLTSFRLDYRSQPLLSTLFEAVRDRFEVWSSSVIERTCR